MQISSSAQASPVTYITQENTGFSLNKCATRNYAESRLVKKSTHRLQKHCFRLLDLLYLSKRINIYAGLER